GRTWLSVLALRGRERPWRSGIRAGSRGRRLLDRLRPGRLRGATAPGRRQGRVLRPARRGRERDPLDRLADPPGDPPPETSQRPLKRTPRPGPGGPGRVRPSVAPVLGEPGRRVQALLGAGDVSPLQLLKERD